MNYFSMVLQLLLLTALPPLAFGLAIYFCKRFYFLFVGEYSGRPLLLAVTVLSTPLRELGHAIMAVISLHRIEDMRLLNMHDPDGEFGFVEHSYNPRNPLALLGNFLYALGPLVIGLFAVLVVFLTCFRGVLSPFFAEISLLVESGAPFGAYAKAAFSLIPRMFTTGDAGVFSKIVGCLLLALIVFGIHVDPLELFDALSGILIFCGLGAVCAGVLMLFDARVHRMVVAGLRHYATALTALFLVVLLFSLALLAFGFIFGVIRTLFNIDPLPEEDEEEDR